MPVSQYLSADPLLLRRRHFYSFHAAYRPHNVLARAYDGTRNESALQYHVLQKKIIARLPTIERRSI
jgi:hypothetical protein